MNTTPEELVRSLISSVCPACGDAKRIRNTLCRNCWDQLPRELQRRLYDTMGNGYEQAVEAAFARLERGRFVLPYEEAP